jgi:hypothetical protein
VSELDKKSLKPSLYFVTAFFLFSEIWDILIYLLFPDRPREMTNLAAVIMRPASIGEILLTIILTVVFILLFSLALAWLLRKLGANKGFFERQRLWLWFLAGVIFSLIEFQEVLGRFWSNVLVLLLLIGLGFVYIRFRESRYDEARASN